jgi:hypothetical protein
MTVYDPNVPAGGAGYLPPATDDEHCWSELRYIEDPAVTKSLA